MCHRNVIPFICDMAGDDNIPCLFLICRYSYWTSCFCPFSQVTSQPVPAGSGGIKGCVLRRGKKSRTQAGQKVAYSGRAKSRVLRQGKRQCAQAGQKAVCSLPPKGAGDMKAIFILVPPGDYYVTGFHNQFPDDLF